MIITIASSALLAATAAFDGYWTSKAQHGGALEIGPSKIIYGPHPTDAALIFKGGAVIIAEILFFGVVAHAIGHGLAGQALAAVAPTVQSVFHIFGGLSGKRYMEGK